ncbi:MAG: tRNA pseudouridine(54/55) synthase Pus10 [Candidatus Aenigmarchaeota archaeon]|nr:tRNA pseudouridine(54/55) synthase Pus10 [Candidatus Aenigmarchaeota archaeon]
MKEKVIEMLKESYVCDRCLGRAMAQLLTGMTNEERGKILRYYVAMLIDSGEKIDVENSNFYGIKFHNKKIEIEKPHECSVCSNLFKELKKKAKSIVKKMKKYGYNTFLVGCKLTPELIEKEQELWDRVGIEWCESIKNEINREIGIEIEKITGKTMNRKSPDVTVMFDLNTDDVELSVRSLYIYGKYQKLVRGIPQTRWRKKIFRTSVQEVIEKPFLKQTKTESTRFHGSGREDINVRCLAWRPFVLELISPTIRNIDLERIKSEINQSKKVKVKDLKIVGKEVVRIIKSADYDKTYRAIVAFEKPVENIKRLDELKGTIITQKTPSRVLRRRSDKIRKRKVKSIKCKFLSKNKVELTITAQAGLYIKELIDGNEGRTEPSVAGLLNNKVKKIELDVIKIHCD